MNVSLQRVNKLFNTPRFINTLREKLKLNLLQRLPKQTETFYKLETIYGHEVSVTFHA